MNLKRVLKIFVLSNVFIFMLGSAFNNPLFAQTDDSGRLRLAQDFERSGNFEAALKIYQNLFNLVSHNQLYYEGVKRNLLRLKKFPELFALIQSQIQQTNDSRFSADLGNVYYKSGEPERAEAIWNSILSQHSQNSGAYIYVANAMLDNQLYDSAIEVYKLARKNLRRDDLFVFELANIYIIRLNYKEATQEFLNYLETNPTQFTFVESRIASYTIDAEQSRPVVEVLQAQMPRSNQEYLIRKLLADLYLRIEDYANAILEFKILEGLKDPLEALNKESGKEIFFFAEKALNAGEYQYAMQAFELILSKYKNTPFRIRALYGVAVAKQKQKLSPQAVQSYNELIAQAPQSPWAPEALFQIGEIYFLDFFELDQALAAYQSLIEKYPQGPKTLEAHFRIGDCYAAKGDMKSAKLWYEKPINLNSSNSEIREQGLYKSAFIDFLNGDFDPALEKLNQVTQHIGQNRNGDQSFVNDALELTILIEENKRSSAEALKDFAETQKFNQQRKTAEAIAKLQAILANYPTAPIVDESLLELGDLEDRRGNFAAAIDYFQTLLKDHPESVYNALAQKRIGETYELGLGDPRKAYEAYEQVLIKYPTSLYLEEVRHKLRALQGRQLNN